MKMIYPERGFRIQEATNSRCCNVQIIPIRRKYGVSAEWGRGEY